MIPWPLYGFTFLQKWMVHVAMIASTKSVQYLGVDMDQSLDGNYIAETIIKAAFHVSRNARVSVHLHERVSTRVLNAHGKKSRFRMD